jgi:hypothetical protein
MNYDDWKATDTTDEGEPPACEGERGCDAAPTEDINMRILTGDDGAPVSLRLCRRCAEWTVNYWRRRAAAERI